MGDFADLVVGVDEVAGFVMSILSSPWVGSGRTPVSPDQLGRQGPLGDLRCGKRTFWL